MKRALTNTNARREAPYAGGGPTRTGHGGPTLSRRRFIYSAAAGLMVPFYGRVTKAQEIAEPPAGFPMRDSLDNLYPIFWDNFSGSNSGYNKPGWTASGTGTITANYGTSPAPLDDGVGSLRINLSSQNGNTTSANFTAAATLWYFFMVRFVSALPGSGKVWFRIRDNSSTDIGRVEMNGTNRFLLRDLNGGTHTASPTTTVAADTTYNVWIKVATGSGANAFGSLAFDTTTTEPTSGANFASFSNGAQTTNAVKVNFGAENNSSWQGIFDKLRVKSSSIGNNPT